MMNWESLKSLVDAWHDAASQMEGYQDTTTEGDGIQLMLFVNRTKEGDVRLSVLSAKDWFSTHTPSELMQPADLEKLDVPSIPQASITIRDEQ